jgi:hypothetical protein
LNMTYDVPVKLFSFHLILLSLFLLAPEARRLANVLVLNRTAGPSTLPPLGRSRTARRTAVIAQAVFGLYVVGINLYGARQAWTQYGGGAPKSALYGIWNIDSMTVEGQIRPPLVTDLGRSRRLIFDRPTGAAFQSMDDTFVIYTAKIDPADKSIALTRSDNKESIARLTFQRPAADRLVLDGKLNGHETHMELSLFERDRFLLVNRGFHWVQEYPFNW